jgi:hypothetical protein
MSSTMRLGAILVAAAIVGPASTAHAQWKPCKADAARLCPGLKPGSDEMIDCIKSNKAEISPECKKAAAHMKSKMQEQKPEEAQPQREMPPR